MRYRFADMEEWSKQAFGSFLAAIIAVITTVMTVKQQPDIGLLFFFLGLIPVLAGVIRGVHYMNRTSRDYIHLTPNGLEVNRGPLSLTKRANYDDIDHVLEHHDYDRKIVTINLIDNKEITVYGEWLTENDYIDFRNELMKRTKNEKLFRARLERRVL